MGPSLWRLPLQLPQLMCVCVVLITAEKYTVLSICQGPLK